MTNQEKYCESDELIYTSSPTQLRCKNCHKFWFSKDPIPKCVIPELNTIFPVLKVLKTDRKGSLNWTEEWETEEREAWKGKDIFSKLRDITLEWCDQEEKNDYDMNHIRNSTQFGRLLVRFTDFMESRMQKKDSFTTGLQVTIEGQIQMINSLKDARSTAIDEMIEIVKGMRPIVYSKDINIYSENIKITNLLNKILSQLQALKIKP